MMRIANKILISNLQISIRFVDLHNVVSKIGKKTIQIPSGVEVKIDGGSIAVKGPKGELKMALDDSVSVSVKENTVLVNFKSDQKSTEKWGLTRALIANMIKGVFGGFEKNLEFDGVGYKAIVKGDDLELSLGYSHPIVMKIPSGIQVKIEKNTIKLSGIDNKLIGQFAAEIKSKRLPEPYKGHGIKYAGEILIRKAGKKAATAA